MRRLAIAITCACVCASLSSCSDDDPRFGDPSAIKGKVLPETTVLNFFPTAYDPAKPAPPSDTTSATARHKTAGQTPPVPTLSCMGCHGAPGPDTPSVGAARALFAGYLGGRLSGGPAKRADVVVIDQDGVRLEAKTDDQGFFWVADDGKGARQLFVAVRDSAGNEIRMSPGFTVGNCTSGSCHGPSTAAGLALLP